MDFFLKTRSGSRLGPGFNKNPARTRTRFDPFICNLKKLKYPHIYIYKLKKNPNTIFSFHSLSLSRMPLSPLPLSRSLPFTQPQPPIYHRRPGHLSPSAWLAWSPSPPAITCASSRLASSMCLHQTTSFSILFFFFLFSRFISSQSCEFFVFVFVILNGKIINLNLCLCLWFWMGKS